MNEMKQRRKGFLALLLAAVMILGTPGVTALAAAYYPSNFPRTYDLSTPPANPVALQAGDTVTADNGDYVYVNGSSVGSTGGTYTITVTGTTAFTYGSGAIYLTVPSTSSSDDDTPAAKYHRSLGALIRAIKNPGGEIHGYGAGTSLPYAVMKALAENPEDVLVFETDYKGYHYTYTIQGGDYISEMIDPEIPWYGPYWLAQHFFETTTIEKLPC